MHIEERPLESIKPYENNPRHNDLAVDAVAESIRTFGWGVDERWAAVPGYEGLYEVSSYGRLRRSSKSKMAPAGHILKPRSTWDGYLKYGLSKSCRYWHVKAHRLVALAFLGPPPFAGAHVAHFDGDKRNNHVSNLRWATPTENEADKRRHGRVGGLPPGERHPMAKLTVQAVRAMRTLAHGGRTLKSIAEEFRVAVPTAHDAVAGTTWKEVTDPPPFTYRKRRAS